MQDVISEDFRAVIELLVDVHGAKPTYLDEGLLAPLLSMAIIVLSTPSSAYFSAAERSIVTEFLRSTKPSTATYASLIAFVSRPDSKDPLNPPTSSAVTGFLLALPTVRLWATSLKSHRCFHHEASLWSAILSHFEALSFQAGIRQTTSCIGESETIRAELIASVENAELRSFGNKAATAADGLTRTPRKEPRNVTSGTPGEWRWEEVFGCWVMKTPAPIPTRRASSTCLKRVHDDDHTPTKRRRTDFGPRGLRMTSLLGDSSLKEGPHIEISRSPSPRSTLSPTPDNEFRSSSTPATLSPEDEDVDHATPDRNLIKKIGAAGRATVKRQCPDPRRSSFRSLVADALKHRVVLHRQKNPTRFLSHEDSGENMGPENDDFATDVYDTHELSSDDALDLFASRSSEM